MAEQTIPTNGSESLIQSIPTERGWVTRCTAIVIVHGIGNQLPLETLDQFGRGLVGQYQKILGDELLLTHEIVFKPPDTEHGDWFDNVLRIRNKNSQYYIDIYEYYWANYTQDKASWKDLNGWLQGVVTGASSFYKKNAYFGERYKDRSIFFNTKTGKFKPNTYRFFLSVISKIFFAIDFLWKGILWVLSLIPFIGKIADSLLQSYADSLINRITNLAGDVVVYNVVDPKSKFYEVRRKTLDGAVSAIRFPLEKLTADEKGLYYPSVIVAGHSLGSQVAYDAVNKINLLINENRIANYVDGKCILGEKLPIAAQLNGFITFGSPLDKIAFFIRENIPDKQYLRQQFLDHYHGFKQREMDTVFNKVQLSPTFMIATCKLLPHLQEVLWRNYYDDKDYVSGGLDYYDGLTNINCGFKAGRFGFTHSNYWENEFFFADIIQHYLK